MTGFARAEGASGGVSWIWEARSVNGRGLDVKVRTPPGFESLEAFAREAAGKRFKRGSVQATLTLSRETRAAQGRIDATYLAALIDAARPHVDAGAVTPPRWDGLLQVRGVIVQDEGAEAEGDREEHAKAFSQGLELAFDRLLDARRTEGRALQAILNGLLDRIVALTAEARALAGDAPETIAARLRQRVESLSPDIVIDPARFAQEAALIAARGDVTEEMDRLAAHATEARALIAGNDAAGRRLDFLAQEFAREANTLCSKSADLALTRVGLDLKTAVDQLKEQSANVE